MLEGVDYYPRKAKKKPKLKIGFFALLVIFLSVYFYSNIDQSTLDSNTGKTTFIISKAKKQEDEAASSIIIKSNNAYQPIKVDKRVKSDKGLDEVIQSYQKK